MKARQKALIITSHEQARVLSHDLRLKIIQLFNDGNGSRTSKQIADQLQLTPSKVHYHVRELHKADLLDLVETREKAGIIEKYYFPVAEQYIIRLNENDDLSNEENNEFQLPEIIMNENRELYFKALRNQLNSKHSNKNKQKKPNLISTSLHITPEEMIELMDELNTLFSKFESKHPKKTNEVQTYQLMTTLIPIISDEEEVTP